MSPNVHWNAVFSALTQVEGLGPNDSGTLSFRSSPRGSIFVERGRICWVAAEGLQRRLRDLLSVRASGTQAAIDRIYERCRLEGRPFGQTLVADGLIASRELETALRRHSAESLVHLCRQNERTEWSPRGDHGYLPDFTFPASEVLFDVVDVALPGERKAARRGLEPYLGAGLRAAGFLLEPNGAIPVPLFSSGTDATVHVLLALGRWASSLVLASQELAASPRFILAATSAGKTVCAWWRDALLYVLVCEDREAVAAVTARHLRES